jgi:hypothetical protein
MPSTDRKLELKAKTSVAQTGSQPFVYAKGLKRKSKKPFERVTERVKNSIIIIIIIIISYEEPDNF